MENTRPVIDVPHNIASLSSAVQAATIQNIDQHLAENPMQAAETTIQRVWHIARPVVVFLQGATFFKPSWHDAIKALVESLDALTANQSAAPGSEAKTGNMPL